MITSEEESLTFFSPWAPLKAWHRVVGTTICSKFQQFCLSWCILKQISCFKIFSFTYTGIPRVMLWRSLCRHGSWCQREFKEICTANQIYNGQSEALVCKLPPAMVGARKGASRLHGIGLHHTGDPGKVAVDSGRSSISQLEKHWQEEGAALLCSKKLLGFQKKFKTVSAPLLALLFLSGNGRLLQRPRHCWGWEETPGAEQQGTGPRPETLCSSALGDPLPPGNRRAAQSQQINWLRKTSSEAKDDLFKQGCRFFPRKWLKNWATTVSLSPSHLFWSCCVDTLGCSVEPLRSLGSASRDPKMVPHASHFENLKWVYRIQRDTAHFVPPSTYTHIHPLHSISMPPLGVLKKACHFKKSVSDTNQQWMF